MKQQTLKELKAAYGARPFRPFDVVLDDGTRLHVDRPEFIGWSQEANKLLWSSYEETTETFDLRRVAAIEPAVPVSDAEIIHNTR